MVGHPAVSAIEADYAIIQHACLRNFGLKIQETKLNKGMNKGYRYGVFYGSEVDLKVLFDLRVFSKVTFAPE